MTSTPAPTLAQLREHRIADISAVDLYRCCQLRQDVFVIEQDCPYPDMDGRDLEEETVHLYFAAGDDVLAYLRILTDPDEPGAMLIGRVVTRRDARGRRLAGQLMERALEICGPVQISLGAQERLEGWYGAFGFERIGPTYLEDNIPHVPMRRPALS